MRNSIGGGRRREIPTVRILDSFQTEKLVAVYFGETSTKFHPYKVL
jgi:hypothetical protein